MAVIDGILKTNSSTLGRDPYYFRGASYIIDATQLNASGEFSITMPAGFGQENNSIFYIRMPNIEVTYTDTCDLTFFNTRNSAKLYVKSLTLGAWTNISTHYYNESGVYKFTDPGVIIPVYYYSNSFRVLGNPLLSSGTSSDGTVYYSIYADGLIEQWGVVKSSSDNKSVSFTINFSDTNYIVTGTGHSGGSYSQARYGVHSKTINSCKLYWNSSEVEWSAKGY